MFRVLVNWAVDLLIRLAKRDPYRHLPGYMERYWVLRPRAWLPLSIRVHHILRSDGDRHLHDHPWPWCSIILRGTYTEQTPLDQAQSASLDDLHCTYHRRTPGSLVVRPATSRHRLHLAPHSSVWSLFLMGRATRKWGFHTEHGWVYWRDYLGDYTTVTANDGDTR